MGYVPLLHGKSSIEPRYSHGFIIHLLCETMLERKGFVHLFCSHVAWCNLKVSHMRLYKMVSVRYQLSKLPFVASDSITQISDKGLLSALVVAKPSFRTELGFWIRPRSRRRASHDCMLSAYPPSILTGFSSADFPSTVPWYLDSSPVLLCFFFRAVRKC